MNDGKGLIGINLLANCNNTNGGRIWRVGGGWLGSRCPKLKSLTLESGFPSMFRFDVDGLEALSKGCKELKNLKITNGYFVNVTTIDEVKEIFPNCKVELKNCGDKEAFDGYFWSGFDLTSVYSESWRRHRR